MTCECFYVINNQSIEGAREFAKSVDALAKSKEEEVFPVYICKALKDFYATSDYDNYNPDFKVKKGMWLVFAQGKDYCMDRIRPKGGRRGFPNKIRHDDFYKCFNEYIEDVEELFY